MMIDCEGNKLDWRSLRSDGGEGSEIIESLLFIGVGLDPDAIGIFPGRYSALNEEFDKELEVEASGNRILDILFI